MFSAQSGHLTSKNRFYDFADGVFLNETIKNGSNRIQQTGSIYLSFLLNPVVGTPAISFVPKLVSLLLYTVFLPYTFVLVFPSWFDTPWIPQAGRWTKLNYATNGQLCRFSFPHSYYYFLIHSLCPWYSQHSSPTPHLWGLLSVYLSVQASNTEVLMILLSRVTLLDVNELLFFKIVCLTSCAILLCDKSVVTCHPKLQNFPSVRMSYPGHTSASCFPSLQHSSLSFSSYLFLPLPNLSFMIMFIPCFLSWHIPLITSTVRWHTV